MCPEKSSMPMELLTLEASVPNFPQPVEENCPCKCILRFPLIQACLNSAAEFDILQPVESEQTSLDSAKLPKSYGKTILPWIAADFPNDKRCCYSPLHIPAHSGHLFRFIPDSNSDAIRTLVPIYSGHLFQLIPDRTLPFPA